MGILISILVMLGVLFGFRAAPTAHVNAAASAQAAAGVHRLGDVQLESGSGPVGIRR